VISVGQNVVVPVFHSLGKIALTSSVTKLGVEKSIPENPFSWISMNPGLTKMPPDLSGPMRRTEPILSASISMQA
jgi:hypothetical protein